MLTYLLWLPLLLALGAPARAAPLLRAMVCANHELITRAEAEGSLRVIGAEVDPSLRARLEALLLGSDTGLFDTRLNRPPERDLLASVDRAPAAELRAAVPGCAELFVEETGLKPVN